MLFATGFFLRQRKQAVYVQKFRQCTQKPCITVHITLNSNRSGDGIDDNKTCNRLSQFLIFGSRYPRFSYAPLPQKRFSCIPCIVDHNSCNCLRIFEKSQFDTLILESLFFFLLISYLHDVFRQNGPSSFN